MIQRPLARLLARVCTMVCLSVAVAAPVLAAPLTFTIPIPEDAATVRPGVDTDRLVVPGEEWKFPTDPGTPMLPYRFVRVVLPQGQEVDTFQFKFGGESRVAAGFKPEVAVDLIGAEGETIKNDPTVKPSTVQRIKYLGTGTLHGYQVATFAVYPFGLEAGVLRRANQVDLAIDTRPLTATTTERIRHRDGWREEVRAHIAALVINPGALAAYAFSEVMVPDVMGGFTASTYPSLEGSPVDYVIVTNDSLAAAYQILADWKTSKGVPTVVRTTEWIAANYRNGSDGAETIRNFVKDAYSLWGIKYLLVGGDSQQVPVRLAYSAFYPSGEGRANPVDMYFGCLDGDWNADHDAVFGEFGSDNADLWSEVYVGRLPTRSNGEVNIMVNKIKNYERPQHTGFPKKVLLLAEVLFPADWVSPQPISLDGATLAEYVRTSYFTSVGLQVARNYQNYTAFPGSNPETRQAAIDSMNTGYDHVIHFGHGFRFNMSVGDASVVNADADALTNGVKLMNLNLLNCTSSAFTYECLAEHFLRNPNGGAVSVVGSNDSAFPTVATDYMSEYYRLIMTQNVVHIGEAFARSREPRTGFADAADGGDRWTHYTYCLLADPEMPLWNGPVATLAVSFAASVNKGTNNIAFTVTSGGNPVDSAVVCLTKGNDDYRVGKTNASGQVTIPFRAESNGTIDVVVTARNKKRYEGTITVGGTGAFIAINNITIDDDNSGGTLGNGNGVIESGETVDLGFVMKNNGSSTSGTITTVLRSTDAGVVVSDSTAGGGTIAAGATGTQTGGCRVVFNSTLTDQHAVPFTLIIKNNGAETWKDTFKKLAHRPGLGLVKLRVDDTVTGNGDGVVQAGEQFKLFYKAKNFGTGTYPGGTMTAFDLDGAFTIGGGGTSAYPVINTLASAENTTGITLTESSVAVEHRLRLRIVDTYGRAYEDTVELRAPVPPTNLVIDPSQGPDRLQVTWTASASSDVAAYNVYRASSGAGPFNLANLDPVPHTLFMNTGLSATTTYFYKVSTIDVSGNESALSTAYSGSTNPAQLTGWPIEMEMETTSSPAVGDIDGDGTFEIVVGDKHVYAWHANGIEMVDGDSNPLSWGILSTQGSVQASSNGGFVSHVALGRIDTNKGLEIVAGSRDTKQVFVFKYNGSVVTGWPRSTLNNMRAGMVVGDINNDGLNEVIVIDEAGVLYVWKRDGTEYRDGDSNGSTNGVFVPQLSGCSLNYSTPCLADIDNDGKDEIIVATQGDQLHAFNDDGTQVSGFPVALSNDVSGSPAVGDVDGDGQLDIVVYIKDGNLRVIRGNNGANLWTRSVVGSINLNFFGSSPAIGDVNGDGKLETFLATHDGKLTGTTYTGTNLTGFPTTYSTTTYTESSPIIADIDNDGLRDILIGSEEKAIWAWNRNGTVIAGFPLTTNDAMRGVPTICDLDKDGKVELVAAGWDKSVYVWDFNFTWNAANAPWPRFHANLHNNGRLNYTVPTPVLGTKFNYTVADERIHLEWFVPVEAGTKFTVERATVENGVTGAFVSIAKNVNTSVDGHIQLSDAKVEMGDRYVYRLSGDTGVVNETMSLYVPVSRAELGQNYPNPFNPTTRIEYWVPEGMKAGERSGVSVTVYDVRGARVRSLVSGAKSAGHYVAQWDGRDDRGTPVSSGIYFYRMTVAGFSGTRKMVLLK
jgi:hypothetical protein